MDGRTHLPKVKPARGVELGPGWIPCQDLDGKVVHPIIRCRCGDLLGIGKHSISESGEVNNSFYDRESLNHGNGNKGCGWHVWLHLDGWEGGAIAPAE